MAEVFELVGEANREEIPGASGAVSEMLGLLGLDSLTTEKVAELGKLETHGTSTGNLDLSSGVAQTLLAEREEARADKDFGRADEIRDRLAELGWEVRDSSDGAKLVPKS
jgi:cysteinyl-tRNA synthetase